MSEAILEVKDVSKIFGGLVALNQVNFSVPKGIIKSVIGPNGAGKTTLFNAITNVFEKNSGQVFFKGQNVTTLPTHRLAAMGLARTFQIVRLFQNMTVLENVLVGFHRRTTGGFWQNALGLPGSRAEERLVSKKARDILKFVGLEGKEQFSADSLPLGQEKLLEIARSLASDPEMLLLDEPAAGLNDSETRDLADILRKVRDQGVTILLVEHNMNLVMDISEEIVVINYGEKLAEGTSGEIQANPAVIAAYLGEEGIFSA